MTAKFFLGVLAYVIPLFPLAYLWHLRFFKAAYDRLEIFRPEVILPFGLLSMVMQGVFFSWVFPKLFIGSGWVTNGLHFALVFGLLGWSFMVLPVAAKYRMTSVSGFMALETAFIALQFLLTGLLLAFVYRS
jgi:hydrogenase-4 membrane subunit HyfE